MPDVPDHVPPPETETLAPRAGECLWLDRFVLSVVSGPDRGALAMSPGERMVVGTDPSCDFRLSDRSMSRFHCEIAISDEGLSIRDMGSTNGTRVNGVRIQSAWLRRGVGLELGRNLMRFDMAGEQVGLDLYPHEQFGGLLGRSVAMRLAFARLDRAATTSATVLLSGETGTGKDLAAEAIHQQSARSGGPFVVVDCGGLPAGILASELFGHARGAFTGAGAERVGAIEAADGGTLFLDEIGEMPLDLQPLLLRALERHEIQRVGETQRRAVNFRVVAATHRDLRRAVNSGRFRADLYYRLAVLPVRMPPLRERDGDIPLLCEHFVRAVAREPASRERLAARLSPAELARHDWPGNVRELRNHIESCAVVNQPSPGADGEDADGRGTGWTGLPPPGSSQPFRVARNEWLRWFERQYMEDLLTRHQGNVAAAARAAEVDRAYIYRLLGRTGLRG